MISNRKINYTPSKLIIYVSTIYFFLNKATRFDLSFGHLQAFIADNFIGAL